MCRCAEYIYFSAAPPKSNVCNETDKKTGIKNYND